MKAKGRRAGSAGYKAASRVLYAHHSQTHRPPAPKHAPPTSPFSLRPYTDHAPRHWLPSCGDPRSPSTTIRAPTLTAHPTLSRRRPKLSGRLVSLLHPHPPHKHPPHFLALASLPLLRSFPQPPLARLHTPKHLHPDTASSPPPAARPSPRMRGRRPSCLPRARGSRVGGSLRERGLRRTTLDPRSVSCLPPPERWGEDSPLGYHRE